MTSIFFISMSERLLLTPGIRDGSLSPAEPVRVEGFLLTVSCFSTECEEDVQDVRLLFFSLGLFSFELVLLKLESLGLVLAAFVVSFDTCFFTGFFVARSLALLFSIFFLTSCVKDLVLRRSVLPGRVSSSESLISATILSHLPKLYGLGILLQKKEEKSKK